MSTFEPSKLKYDYLDLTFNKMGQGPRAGQGRPRKSKDYKMPLYVGLPAEIASGVNLTITILLLIQSW